MAYFVPTTAGFDTDTLDKSKIGERWIKLEIDHDSDTIYTDYTGYIFNNSLSGSGKRSGANNEAVSNSFSVTFQNKTGTFDAGDLANAPVKISVKIGSANPYIQIFTGWVDEKGCQRVRGDITKDLVTLHFIDGLAIRGVRKTPAAAIIQAHKIADPAATSNSIMHWLAFQMGEVAGNIDFAEINYTKDLVVIDGKRSALQELQELCSQYLALLRYRYDGKLVAYSQLQTGWADPVSEWTFSVANKNILGEIKINSLPAQTNYVETKLEEWQTLAQQIIYKNLTDYDDTTKKISIEIAAGEYWPGGSTAGDKARLEYSDYLSGEEFPVGVDIITPTIGLSDSGSDIEADIAGLSLISFNGSTGATRQNPDSSEIILRNTSGSLLTITKFEVRGKPIRQSKQIEMRDYDSGLSEWEYKKKEIPGKYASGTTQADYTIKWWRRYGEIPRRVFDFQTVFTPQIQEGAVVTLVLPDETVTAWVDSWSHVPANGAVSKYRTSVKLIEKEVISFTTSPDATYELLPPPGGASAETGTMLMTHTDAQDGYVAARGSKTPTIPTIIASPFFRTIVIQIDRQLNLTNFSRYELQVSSDNATWYALKLDGTDWKGGLAGVTQTTTEIFQHTNIPPGGTADDPTALTLYYRCRRVTKQPLESSWSASVSATMKLINAVDAAKNIITAAKVHPDALKAANENLVAYWSLDDGAGAIAKDNSGGGFNATLYNSPTWINGKSGKALTFNGTTQYGNAGDVDITTNALTFSVWAKTSYPATSQEILRKQSSYIFRIGVGVLVFYVHDGTDWRSISETASIFDDEWHHLVAVWDGTTAWLYVDGVMIKEQALAYTMALNNNNLYIGSSVGSASFFNGSLDEIRIYDKALTEAEIKYLYQNPGGPVQSMITTDRLVANCITADEIAANAVTAAKILAGTITADKINTVSLETLLLQAATIIAGFTGTNYSSPAEGDRRMYIDGDEIGFEEYTGGAWATVNSIKLGGVDANGIFAPFLQCRGVINSQGDTPGQEFFPENGYRVFNFENNYADQNGVDDWSTKSNVALSTVQKKFGSYSLFATAGNKGYLAALGTWTVGKSQSLGCWLYFPNLPPVGYNLISLGTNVGGDSVALHISGSTLYASAWLGGTPTTVQATESLTAGQWHYGALVYNKIANTITVVLNNEKVSASVSGSWAATGTPNNFLYVNNAFVVGAETVTNYIDEYLLAFDKLIDPDIFIQHYNHNQPWDTDFTAKDLALIPQPGGRLAWAEPGAGYNPVATELSMGTPHEVPAENTIDAKRILFISSASASWVAVDVSSKVPPGTKSILCKYYYTLPANAIYNYFIWHFTNDNTITVASSYYQRNVRSLGSVVDSVHNSLFCGEIKIPLRANNKFFWATEGAATNSLRLHLVEYDI